MVPLKSIVDGMAPPPAIIPPAPTMTEGDERAALLTTRVPLLMVVLPENVFAPLNTRLFVPPLTSDKVPAPSMIAPLNNPLASLLPTVNVIGPATALLIRPEPDRPLI